MSCPHCRSTSTTQRSKMTSLGYRTFCCQACKRTFNERTGTAYNYLEFPTDIVLLVVLWRVRYKLSLRDLAEMFLERGFEFTHEAVREWEARFAPLVADRLRAKRKGQVGRSWHVDETYIKIGTRWHSLFRASDEHAQIVDVFLSRRRDAAAARAFFETAYAVNEGKPTRVTSDKAKWYLPALQAVLPEVEHRTSKYLNNGIERDH